MPPRTPDRPPRGGPGPPDPGEPAGPPPGRGGRWLAFVREADPRDLLVAVLALAAGIALFASYFATVIYVSVRTRSCEDLAGSSGAALCHKTGGDQHSIAFLVLAVAVVTLGVLAARGMPAAALALLVIGAVAIAITLAGDLPQTTRSGAIGPDFTPAVAHKGVGFWLELWGGALALVAGLAGLVRQARTR